MATPLRELLCNAVWWTKTSHFTVLAAGPGAFREILQRRELATAQELNSSCFLTPQQWVTSPDLMPKRTAHRAYSMGVPAEHYWRSNSAHLLVTSPDCNGCFHHKGQQWQRQVHYLHAQARGRVERSQEPAIPTTPACLLFSLPGLNQTGAGTA